MATIGKFSKAFDQGQEKGNQPQTKTSGMDVVKQSLAIVHTIDKLKAQGVQITKKAELDYLLALRVLEKANVNPEEMPPAQELPDIKRNPKDHPREFEVAMSYSQRLVFEVETKQRLKQHIPDKMLEDYEICKKFLKKYADKTK